MDKEKLYKIFQIKEKGIIINKFRLITLIERYIKLLYSILFKLRRKTSEKNFYRISKCYFENIYIGIKLEQRYQKRS